MRRTAYSSGRKEQFDVEPGEFGTGKSTRLPKRRKEGSPLKLEPDHDPKQSAIGRLDFRGKFRWKF